MRALARVGAKASELAQTGDGIGLDDRNVEVDQPRIVDGVATAVVDAVRIVAGRAGDLALDGVAAGRRGTLVVQDSVRWEGSRVGEVGDETVRSEGEPIHE